MCKTKIQRTRRSLFQSFIVLLSFSLFFVSLSYSNGKKLTYRQVYMKGGEKLTKTLPYLREWLDDNYYIQTRKVKKSGKVLSLTEKVNAKTGEKITVEKKIPGKHFPEGFRLSDYIKKTADGFSYLFLKKSNIYYYSIKSDEFKQLTNTSEEKKNVTFSPNGEFIAYTKKRDLYVIGIGSNEHYRITSNGSEEIYNGWASWIYYEEILGRRSRYRAFWWSPDSKSLVFFRFDNTKVPKFTITDSRGVHGNTEITSYPKPGDASPKVDIGIYHLNNRKTVWTKHSLNRDVYFAKPSWTPDSRAFFLQEINRGQDHLILYSVDIYSGTRKKVYEEKQKSWIDFYNGINFLTKNKGFLILSDVDGWSHIYCYSMDGRLKSRITRGNWRVKSIKKIDEKKGFVYFTGFKNRSTENHLFRVGLNGRGLKQLSKEEGYHYFRISPGFKYYIDSYSSINHPTVRNLYKMNGKLVRKIDSSSSEKSKKYNLGRVELFTIPSGDGYELPAIWILPPNFDKSKKYPVLFKEYGGPDFAIVRNSYQRLSSYYLAQEGIIIFSVDHRGSGHFGKRGVALMHRSLGKWEMHDFIAAVKWLKKKKFIDPKKIAISGGSYGGYVTAMALTYGADYFTHGIASSSVIDWKLYDSFYTEKFMDKPAENPEGYKKSSVIEYAGNLKGKLLIVHGTMDDNVHLQNSLRLISKLQNLNKDFEMMFYPGGRHGWGGKKRIHSTRLSVQFWFKNLLGRDLDIDKD